MSGSRPNTRQRGEYGEWCVRDAPVRTCRKDPAPGVSPSAPRDLRHSRSRSPQRPDRQPGQQPRPLPNVIASLLACPPRSPRILGELVTHRQRPDQAPSAPPWFPGSWLARVFSHAPGAPKGVTSVQINGGSDEHTISSSRTASWSTARAPSDTRPMSRSPTARWPKSAR